MSRYALLGALACVAGGVLLAFQKIAVYMGIEATWKALSVADIVGHESIARLAGTLPSKLEPVAGYVAGIPLYVLLFGTGALILVLDHFWGRR